MRKPHADCHTMAEVRASIDDLDRELVNLLAERFRFMDAAARIKRNRSEVRDEPRKREVIDNAARRAAALGLPAGAVEQLWETLVEASIAYELASWDNGHAADDTGDADIGADSSATEGCCTFQSGASDGT